MGFEIRPAERTVEAVFGDRSAVFTLRAGNGDTEDGLRKAQDECAALFAARGDGAGDAGQVPRLAEGVARVIDALAGPGWREELFGDAPPNLFCYLELREHLLREFGELNRERWARIAAIAGGVPPLPREADGGGPAGDAPEPRTPRARRARAGRG
jgi:hypothetical protein